MQHLTAARRMGFLIAAIVFLFTLTTVGQADAKTTSLKKMLSASGIGFKVVKLDRTDGFLYGFSFKGKKIPSVTIAPGFGRMLLVQVNGNEMIFQGNGAGKMQIIQADGDFEKVLCILDSVIDFLRGLQTSQGDAVSLFMDIFALVTQITACGAETPAPVL